MYVCGHNFDMTRPPSKTSSLLESREVWMELGTLPTSQSEIACRSVEKVHGVVLPRRAKAVVHSLFEWNKSEQKKIYYIFLTRKMLLWISIKFCAHRQKKHSFYCAPQLCNNNPDINGASLLHYYFCPQFLFHVAATKRGSRQVLLFTNITTITM